MKLGLIGDVHGNAVALHAVLLSAAVRNVEKLLITGDLVGYYFQPLQVLELLAPWEKVIVRGNHEAMLSMALQDPEYLEAVGSKYGSGIRLAIQQLSTIQVEYLCALPHPLQLQLDGARILLCHGSPWNVDQYVYPDSNQSLIERCVSDDFDLVVTGHTHYPMVKKIGSAVLVNPGSVGQPRNRRPGAAWAIFDTVDRTVELRSESYDSAELVRECRLRHPELPYLSEVLLRT